MVQASLRMMEVGKYFEEKKADLILMVFVNLRMVKHITVTYLLPIT